MDSVASISSSYSDDDEIYKLWFIRQRIKVTQNFLILAKDKHQLRGFITFPDLELGDDDNE